MPSAWVISYMGSTTANRGSARKISASTSSTVETQPGKRDSAYAAGTPMSRATTVLITATTSVLLR